MKVFLSRPQFKLLSGFFSNISVAWFVAAFITPAGLLTKITALANMIMSLAIALLFRGIF